MLSRPSPLIRQSGSESSMQGRHATHTHMTSVVSHTFIRSRYKARMASRQLFGTVTFSCSQLRLHSPTFRLYWENWSRSSNGRSNESQVVLIPEYQSSILLIGMFSIAKISVGQIRSSKSVILGPFSGICHASEIISFSFFFILVLSGKS